MKILNFVACEDVIRDAETDKVSLINIIEQINSIGFPALQAKMAVFIFIEKEGDEKIIDGNIIIKNNDRVLFKNVVSLDFVPKDRIRVIFKINGVAIYEAGELAIEFIYGEKSDKLIIPLAQQAVQVPQTEIPTVIERKAKS